MSNNTSRSTHARFAYILLVDGIPWGWASHYELTRGWWTYDDRRILPGLRVPDLRFALDFERGLLQDETVTFKILDVDGSILPGFFSGLIKDYKLLGQRLPPTVDPAPTSSFDQYGDVLTLHDGTSGCYIGLEAIGPDGERHYYSCWPGNLTAGHDHGGGSLDDALPVHTTSGEGPYLVEGRKACLFRIFANNDGTWPEFNTAAWAPDAQDVSRPIWWGTMLQAGGVDGRTWSLSFAGPGSWLQKTLNAKSPANWLRVRADLALDDLTDKIYLNFTKTHYTGQIYQFGQDDTYTVTPGDLTSVLASINTAITAVKNAAGPDGVWTGDDPIDGSQGNIDWKKDYIAIWTNESIGYAANCDIGMHWRVWRFLGYDPEVSYLNYNGPQPYFYKRNDVPGYYFAALTTVPHGVLPLVPDGTDEWDGEGLTKVYNPLYESSLAVLPGTGQTWVKITDIPGEPIYCESQTIRPPKTSVQIDGQACNATRWWVFRGQISRAEIINGLPTTTEPEEIYQVAKCSWVSNDGFMGSSDGIFADLYIESWHDPRLFGFHSEPLDPQMGWAALNTNEGGIECAPLAVWGTWSERDPSTGRGTDRIYDTLMRLLTSTGLAEVDPSADDPGDAELESTYPDQSYLTPGPGGPQDREIADLGLGIPRALVDNNSISLEQALLPSGLREVKVAVVGPVQAEEVILGLLGPGNWSLGIWSRRLQVFARHGLAAGTVTSQVITVSDLAGEAGDPTSSIPGLDLRPVQPFDGLTAAHTAHPVDDPVSGQEELRCRARDLGARSRPGVRLRDVAAPYLPAPRWWKGVGKPVASWELDFKGLWEQTVASWLAKPHRLVRGLRVARPTGQFLFPGQRVLMSIPWPLNTEGGYGMANAYGRVVAATHDPNSCEVTADILVHADTSVSRIWAPIARVVDDVEEPEERYDPATRTFYCRSWAEDDDPEYTNIETFVEPAWSVAGGNAFFWVLQYDGVSWVKTCSGFIESVDTTNGTIVHAADGFGGGFYERMYAVIVVAPYDDGDQAVWPQTLFHILGPKSGLPESRKLAQ